MELPLHARHDQQTNGFHRRVLPGPALKCGGPARQRLGRRIRPGPMALSIQVRTRGCISDKGRPRLIRKESHGERPLAPEAPRQRAPVRIAMRGPGVSLWRVIERARRELMGRPRFASRDIEIGRTGFASAGPKLAVVTEVAPRRFTARRAGVLDAVWFNCLCFYDAVRLTLLAGDGSVRGRLPRAGRSRVTRRRARALRGRAFRAVQLGGNDREQARVADALPRGPAGAVGCGR